MIVASIREQLLQKKEKVDLGLKGLFPHIIATQDLQEKRVMNALMCMGNIEGVMP